MVNSPTTCKSEDRKDRQTEEGERGEKKQWMIRGREGRQDEKPYNDVSRAGTAIHLFKNTPSPEDTSRPENTHSPEDTSSPKNTSRAENTFNSENISSPEVAIKLNDEKRVEKRVRDEDSVLLYDGYSPLSNSYPAEFQVEGQKFTNITHYLEYRKALYFRDQEAAGKILQTSSHQELTSSHPEWEQLERRVLIEAMLQKFGQNVELRENLLDTGNSYLLHSSRDEMYGHYGSFPKPQLLLNRKQWHGKNIEGEALMETREMLRKKAEEQSVFGNREQSDRDTEMMEGNVGKRVKGLTDVYVSGEVISDRVINVRGKWVHKKDSETLVYISKESPFSDLHPAPFTVEGQRFSCAEQYTMYHRALLFEDQEGAEEILQCKDPVKMSSLRGVNGITREHMKRWEEYAEEIMKDAEVYKYSQNPELKELLFKTGELYLGRAHTDRFYGTGVVFESDDALDRNKWTGENRVGKALMAAREILRREDGLESREECSESGEELVEGFVPVWEKWIHRRNSDMFLYSSWSPLSTMYPSSFTVDGETYSCSYQYILNQQALMFRDEEAATRILNTIDPEDLVRIPVKGFNGQQWEECVEDIRIDAYCHSLSQNEKLKRLLLDTGDLYIGHMGKNVKYSTGVDIHTKYPFDRSRWTGENKDGKLLMLIREKLQNGPLEEYITNRKTFFKVDNGKYLAEDIVSEVVSDRVIAVSGKMGS